MESEVALLEVFELEKEALKAQNWRYRILLEEHGVDLEEDPLLQGDGALEMYRASKRVIRTAGDFLAAVRALERAYGTSLELVDTEAWSS